MSYARCQELFRLGLLDALEICRPHVERMMEEGELSNDASHEHAVRGIALDIFPWFTQAAIALRVRSDPETPHLAKWRHYDFFSDLIIVESEAMGEAAQYAADVWKDPPAGVEMGDAAHLTFLAGAEALLDDSVQEKLCRILRVDRDSVLAEMMKYYLFHPDMTCESNYCDIVRMWRIKEQNQKLWS
ncbi:hypothetical protein [Lignipirellula cremea]|uniref:Uncharacterized protein n=1 Tax=Lignipirellula cremea TaxID=2528010 RepID=A0A518DXP7_9BACT|nr:hypothetical protein [Lignipirellula cremea]QDU96613.1 hypothetical protein Pla8534_44340 [Lignipirellula cremea]